MYTAKVWFEKKKRTNLDWLFFPFTDAEHKLRRPRRGRVRTRPLRVLQTARGTQPRGPQAQRPLGGGGRWVLFTSFNLVSSSPISFEMFLVYFLKYIKFNKAQFELRGSLESEEPAGFINHKFVALLGKWGNPGSSWTGLCPPCSPAHTLENCSELIDDDLFPT